MTNMKLKKLMRDGREKRGRQIGKKKNPSGGRKIAFSEGGWVGDLIHFYYKYSSVNMVLILDGISETISVI